MSKSGPPTSCSEVPMNAPEIDATGPEQSFGPLTRTDFVRYAGASNDFNPMHHDDGVAQSNGEPSVFAHGMFSMGLLASYVVEWLAPGSLRRISVRFHDRVWPGDELVAQGRVAAIAVESDTRLLDVEVSLSCGDQVVVTGEATVAVRA